MLAVLVATACTPSSSEPPNPTLTPAIPTPAESSFERQQRLDFEAGESALRSFRSEYREVLEAGGAPSATFDMKKYAGGAYLAEFTDVVKAYKRLGYRQRGMEPIIFIHRTAHLKDGVQLTWCADGRKVETIDRSGKLIGKGDLRQAVVVVKRVDDDWKVWSGDGKAVKSC